MFKRTICALVCALALAVGVHAQSKVAKTATPPATVSSSNGFAASSSALAVDYQGSWSAGTLVTESLDFLDFGATKSNRLYVVGNQFLAPTPGFSLYTGGLKIEPDLSKALSRTNVTAANLGVFMDASIGSGLPPTGGSHVAWMAGGGVKYALTSNLTWQSLQVQYGAIGAQRLVGISTGLSFVFTR